MFLNVAIKDAAIARSKLGLGPLWRAAIMDDRLDVGS
jgi:hypothetical protein